MFNRHACICVRAHEYTCENDASMNVDDDREKVIRRPADLDDFTEAFFYKRTRIVPRFAFLKWISENITDDNDKNRK